MKLIWDDCVLAMADMEDASIDCVITDPPYGLKFMGKKWDYNVPSVEVWREVLRVMKPGAYLLSFGGTRTYHRMVVAIEDAGFEIRDQIQWLYGSGFPKSHDVSKGIDKAAGNEKVVGFKKDRWTGKGNSLNFSTDRPQQQCKITAPSTPEAKQWQGWGTALKPAHEPIVLARKPLSETTVAKNVLRWGTGALNIDACRIELGPEGLTKGGCTKVGGLYDMGMKGNAVLSPNGHPQGRWPANIILDEEAGKQLDLFSGPCKTGKLEPHHKLRKSDNLCMSGPNQDRNPRQSFGGDSGGASRFFYCAKASKAERNAGLEGMETKDGGFCSGAHRPNKPARIGANPHADNPKVQNNHPTVKPLKLMEYLIKLATPAGGTVLDPFMGTGTTGIASGRLGNEFIGIELNKDYYEIAKKRIDNVYCHRT